MQHIAPQFQLGLNRQAALLSHSEPSALPQKVHMFI